MTKEQLEKWNKLLNDYSLYGVKDRKNKGNTKK